MASNWLLEHGLRLKTTLLARGFVTVIFDSNLFILEGIEIMVYYLILWMIYC